jgi:mRNA interferase ChpB
VKRGKSIKVRTQCIVTVNLDPTEGHEQRGMRLALVPSTHAFNVLGLVLVAPITQGGDFAPH